MAVTIVVAVVFVVINKVFIVRAAINPLYNFKGKVTDANGSEAVADTTYDLNFSLYTAATGGAPIWAENLTATSTFSATISAATAGADTTTYDYTGGTGTTSLRVGQRLTSASSSAVIVDFNTSAGTVEVTGTSSPFAVGAAINNRPRTTGGVLDVDLGAVSDLTNVDFNQILYLEVTFNGEVMRPRKVISSVPQAFNAAKLNGLDSSAFINTSDDITATGRWNILNTLSVATSSATTTLTITQNGSGEILQLRNAAAAVLTVLANGNVGIGTSTPDERLQVIGDIKWSGDLIAMGTTQSIGSPATRINNGYFTNLDVLNMSIASTSISGAAANVFTINSDNVSADLEDSTLAFHRGTASPADATLTWNSTDDRFETNFPLHLQSNNFTTLGNAGIGTTTPISRLSVYGDLSLTAANSYVNFGGGTGTTSYGFRDNGGVIEMKNVGGNWQVIGAGGSGTVGTGITGQIAYFNANGTAVSGTSTLYIMSNGSIGIGTTTLAVGGEQSPKLAVAGAIAANFYCDENGNHCVDASAGWGVSGSFVGTTTATTNGAFATSTLIGYQAGNDMCVAEFSGSHFCRTDEIIYTIATKSISNFAGTAWIAEGPPGYTYDSNDCNGWATSSSLALGAYWLMNSNGGGAGWLVNCSMTKPVACCR